MPSASMAEAGERCWEQGQQPGQELGEWQERAEQCRAVGPPSPAPAPWGLCASPFPAGHCHCVRTMFSNGFCGPSWSEGPVVPWNSRVALCPSFPCSAH